MSLATKIQETNMRCGDCPIRHRAVCAYAGPVELVTLSAIKSYHTYQAGETIAWAGERIENIGSVVTGVATISRTLPDGRRQMVGLLLPSDFVGRPGRDSTPYDVVATNEVVMCQFRKKDFEDLVNSTPKVGKRLLEMTLDELDSAREWMLLLGRKTAREKIASLLAIIARRNAILEQKDVVDGLQFSLPLTREAMSDYLGLTIETVSRQISALKKDGIIDLVDSRHIRVPDFAILLDEAGDDSDGGMIS